MLRYRSRRQTAWLAVFAILLNALAPWVSHANAARADATAIEVCTADGILNVSVAGDAGSRHGAPVIGSSGTHCPYCLPQGNSVALPPVAFAVPIITGPHAAPAAFESSLCALPLWAAHQARAPPVAQ
jgi:hypothetical protein